MLVQIAIYQILALVNRICLAIYQMLKLFKLIYLFILIAGIQALSYFALSILILYLLFDI